MSRLSGVIVLSAAMIAVAMAAALAQPAATDAQAASQPAATQPATQAATAPADEVDPAALKILLDLQAAGEAYPTIRADVEFHELLSELGDEQTRTGWVAYQAGDANNSPAKFRIHFDRLKLGEGRWAREQVDYAFDGQWLSVAKHKVKDMQHFQVVAEGERAEPLKLGKGPFPVPFGQRADDVLKYFVVTTRPAEPSDPANTDYLLCITRREFRDEINFRRLEMWIDRSTHLPVRIVSADVGKTIVTVTFSDIKPGRPGEQPFEADMFRFTDGQFGPGWTSARHPLGSGSGLMP